MLNHRGITPEEQRVLDRLDMAGLLTTVDEWVRVPSLNGSAEENLMQERVAETMRSIGLEVETWPFTYDELRQHPAFSVEAERSHGLGVVGKMGRGAGRSLILNGHTDVVPAGDLSRWRYPPWQATLERETGHLYGRGVLDMKGNLACALYAAKAIREAGVDLDGQLLIQAVMGEEDGGIGTLAAVQRGYRADAAIVLEPTQLMVAPAHAGALNFRVTIRGQPAHGAMRHDGVDPLEKFLVVYQVILAFERARNEEAKHPLFEAYETPYPICVGTIRGGNWASTVAESLTFEGRLGVAVGETPEMARAAFAYVLQRIGTLDSWLAEHPPTLEWWGGQFAPAIIPADAPLISLVSQAYEAVAHQAAVLRGMTYGADMRLLVNEGQIPTILFGAGSVQHAHQFDEFVPLSELEALTRTLILTILRFCRSA